MSEASIASTEAAAGASSTGAPTTAAASSSAPRLLTAHSSVGRHAWKSQQQWLQAREQSWAEKSDFAAADDDDDDDDGQFDGDGDVDGDDAARESAPQHFARAASLPEGPLRETSGPGQCLHDEPLGIDSPTARRRAAGSTASLPAERGTPPLWRHSAHDGGGGGDAGDLSPRARSQTLLAPGSSSSARAAAAAAAAAKASSSSHKAGKGERDQAALFDWFAERNFLRAKTKHSHEKGGDKGDKGDRQLRTPRT